MGWRRKLLVTAGVLVLAGGVVAALFDRIVIAALTPGAPFDPANVPAPPNYADEAAWSALPGRVDAADAAVATLDAGDQANAAVDVFYVHPTSYVGGRGTGGSATRRSTRRPTWAGPACRPHLLIIAAPSTRRATARPISPRSCVRRRTATRRSGSRATT